MKWLVISAALIAVASGGLLQPKNAKDGVGLSKSESSHKLRWNDGHLWDDNELWTSEELSSEEIDLPEPRRSDKPRWTEKARWTDEPSWSESDEPRWSESEEPRWSESEEPNWSDEPNWSEEPNWSYEPRSEEIDALSDEDVGNKWTKCLIEAVENIGNCFLETGPSSEYQKNIDFKCIIKAITELVTCLTKKDTENSDYDDNSDYYENLFSGAINRLRH